MGLQLERNLEDLKVFWSLPVETLEAYSIEKILAADDYAKENGMTLCVSDSGGKDSGVLMHLMKKSGVDFISVFSDTGLEYPEVKEMAINRGAIVIKPKLTFKQVLEKHGYPVIAKKTAMMIRKVRGKSENAKRLILDGITIDGNQCKSYLLAKRWRFLIDAPFKISDKCCDVMKKRPLHKFCKKNNYLSIIGITAEESEYRRMGWFKQGCNAFELEHPQSRPLMVWSEQKILEYIRKENIEMASVYGQIMEVDLFGTLSTTGLQRTGCIFCMFGIYEESKKGWNRFDKLLETHPKLWNYAMYNLGIAAVLDFIGIPYRKPTGGKK